MFYSCTKYSQWNFHIKMTKIEMATDLSEIVSEIVFENNPLKVCYSGQLLKGVVKICFPSNTCVQAIYIKFVGEGFYSWVDDISDREKTGIVNYLVKRIDLVPSSNGGMDVSAGSNEYPFEIPLPSKLPTSFEGTYGHIRYTMALCVAPLGITSDPVPVMETFTVIKPLNLNRSFSYIMPMIVVNAVQFDFGFTRLCVLFRWKKGYLKISGRLPVSGYCCGQIMNLQLDVTNESGQGVSVVMIHFIKEVTYNAKDGSTKTESIILIRRKIKGFRGSECSNQSKKINITVPSVPPSSFQSTKDICAFRYMLRITAVTGLWLEKDPVFDVPVTIGTNPITNEMYNSVNNSVNSQLLQQRIPSAPVEAVFPSAPFEPVLPSAPTLDIISGPPTYEEAMLSERSTNNYEFTPKYPVYNKAMSYSNVHFN